jgi:hypothetical protein
MTMMMLLSLEDDIVSKFSMKTLPHIIGEPNYENINYMVPRPYYGAAFC